MTALLSVSDLSRHFGGVAAVDGLSFDVNDNEILGIIGPNGAGKTTAINLISGVIKPDSGSVLFSGEEVTGIAPHRLADKGLVRTFQATTVFDQRTVRENTLRGAYLSLFPGFFPALFATAAARRKRSAAEALVDEVLDWLSLTEVAEITAGNLPYGYQKTLGMAIALAARPRLVMMDEPVAGLSAEEADHVRDTIKRVRERGITVIVIDHNMRFISGLCDRVFVIHQGRGLAVGTPADVLSNTAVIEAYLGKGHGAAVDH
ncbi:ABC transporter ATP-binding protein [Microbaculum marinum]|uniref:ABC transporter ATP-binding protein n=1 Tax=Microbaculum marinum TaxID=1764581 RepID=A0AAW9RPG5_9HYPH